MTRSSSVCPSWCFDVTIWEAIGALESVPTSQRHLPLYVWDGTDNRETFAVSLFDNDGTHGENNPLAVDIERD